jgi:hypothetical protein
MRQRVLCCGVLLASGVAHAAPTIDVDGWCPSVSITVTGATPMREVMIVTGARGGTTTLRGPCAGTTLDLGAADTRRNHVVTARTDASGDLTFTPESLDRNACIEGVQGLDLATCEVTPVVPMTIDCTDADLESGLLAYWPADGHTRDPVGRHHGTIEGAVDYAPGVSGEAFDFDGRSAVKVRPTDDLEFADGEPFTWAMWIYEESGGSQHLFGKRNGCRAGGPFDYQMYIYPDGASSFPTAASHWGPDSCLAPMSGGPPIDTWQHLVAMYDGSRFDLYLDGEFASTSGDCGGDVMNGFGAEFRIGGSGTCSGWVGLIDEVMLWSRTLTADEILCLSAP